MSAPAPDRAADTAARRAAQTFFGAPLVVTAGAGTGKTTVLVARVLAWCLGPGWMRAEAACARPGAPAAPEAVAERALERVVAITFTEAAAAEMETRAMSALANLAAGEAVIGCDAVAEGVDPEERRARAAALLGAFDRLHVQTIHAFCRRLLANHPIAAGLHPRFRVDARGSERAAAVRDALEARLRAMAAAGDRPLEALLERGLGAPELERILVQLIEKAASAEAFAADPLAPDRIRDLVAPLQGAAGALADAAGERFESMPGRSIAPKVAAAASETRARIERGVATAAELAGLCESLASLWPENLQNRLGEWSKDDWADGDARAAGDAGPAIGAAARALGPILRHALDLDVGLLALVHEALAPLLDTASRRLRELGAASFDALLRETRDLLVARPDVAARVRGEIDQLLVDEFQDTDALQCEIVAALALGGDPAARPGLFLVGDPKQSVYGWRNADIGAYMDFVDRVREEPGAAEHGLCVNHRSVPAVLAEVERVVERAMRFEARVQPEFQRLLPSETNAGIAGSGRPDLPAIEYWVSSDREAGGIAKASRRGAAAREAAHLARELWRVRGAQGTPWSAVALLFRATSDLDEYLAALRDADIPYVVDRDRSYYRRREVVEAASLVRAVLDPNDQIAQVAVLRSAWVGVPDAAWQPLWDRSFPDALRDALEGRPPARVRLAAIAGEAARAIAGLDVPGLAAIAGWEASLLHAVDVLAALRRTWLDATADAFVEALRLLPLLEATEAARHPGSFRLANLERFYRELGALLESGDAAAVLRALRRDASDDPEFYEGRPQDPSEEAVQVMTIHGAKGLDFEHVYVLQLHKGSNAGPASGCEVGEVAGRLEWRVEVRRGQWVTTLGFDRIASRRRQVDEAERVRTLYVAMTRAKSRLVLAGDFAGGDAATHARIARDALGGALAGAEAPPAGVEVRFLEGSESEPVNAPTSTGGSAAIDPERAVADAARLRELGREAAARAARPFGGRASAQVPDAIREARGARDAGAEERERAEPGEPLEAEAEVAAAVGTAIHALLERFDWDAEPGAEWARQRDRLADSLAASVVPGRLEVAGARAAELLAKLASGALWPRLRALAAATVARELPVLIRPEARGEGPVGYVSGAIDLVYRDPASGEWVGVDFKTDRIARRADLAARARHHRPQAELYRRAIQEALRLPRAPRVELWFLDADRVEVLEPERAPGEARGRSDAGVG